jgi:hypothetical protein
MAHGNNVELGRVTIRAAIDRFLLSLLAPVW